MKRAQHRSKANQQVNISETDEFYLFEEKAYASGFRFIAGVDEAGRGPLAGPVVAAACMAPLGLRLAGVNDSKQLSSLRRKELYEKIIATPEIIVAVAVIASGTIDAMNILQASLLAMRSAVLQLKERPDFILVDGTHVPSELSIPAQAIVAGDARSFSIAAASIVAKHKRDEIMNVYHEIWPEYQFNKHKGYGTKLHLQAIEKYGFCPIHRSSFEPIKSLRYVA